MFMFFSFEGPTLRRPHHRAGSGDPEERRPGGSGQRLRPPRQAWTQRWQGSPAEWGFPGPDEGKPQAGHAGPGPEFLLRSFQRRRYQCAGLRGGPLLPTRSRHSLCTEGLGAPTALTEPWQTVRDSEEEADKSTGAGPLQKHACGHLELQPAASQHLHRPATSSWQRGLGREEGHRKQ